MLEDLFVRHDELTEELKTANGSRALDLQEAVRALDKVLSEPKKLINFDDAFESTGDPLIDEWEAAIARGEMPDLSKGIVQSKGRKAFTVLPGGGKTP